ncbi:MAG: cobalamin-binding protein [Alicyclobacillus macrosporangiidus]|uniref:ABC transporter substrate-binding protein n=1 Tax=Alicyclobacillus macrosporangiidus TaxID=392015 RepID=UPI0026ECEC35|nr:cobalamin-binding protein [Alicyclobacillus macrosporangiidus]MCL6597860.1 cobalamin-binding protein [Alicyclobacillus macrosporangiidus]
MRTPRIASLCPSNTELLCALGRADCLVAVDNYSDYPAPLVESLPRLGPDLHIDIDALVRIKPDLVLASLSVPGMERVVRQVKEAGLPMLVLNPTSFQDIFDDLRRLAQALGDEVVKDAEVNVIRPLAQRLNRVATATSKLRQRPNLYFEWWPNPIFSPAGANWLTELAELAGGINIFADDPGQQVRDDGRRVIAAAPDYLFAVWTGIPQAKVPIDKIARREGWGQIPAYRNHRIYILCEGLYCRPSPRLMDGLEQLVSLIHPDIARHLGLPEPARYGPIRNADGEWL